MVLTQVSEEKVLATLCKRSFYRFLLEFWDLIVAEPLVANWHIKYLCDELQEVAELVFAGWPKEYDVVINVPPGSSKSTICSQAFPAWCWARMPSTKFICGSYAHQVSLKDSLKTRDIVQSERYQRCFPSIQLREDENTKGLFTNTQMGFRLSVGVGGLVTGYHGHFLIVDDPINPEESFSEAELKSVNRWMTNTLPSRKVDKRVTPTILIQQRLHQADPSGEMLVQKLGKVKHICLPGELTDNDNVSPPELKARYVDNLLDPVRLPQSVLDKLKQELGAYGYAAQILQDPVPLGGGMFQVAKIELVDAEPNKRGRIIRSWDKAGTKDGGNWSVGTKMMVDEARGIYWVLDVVRGQWGAAQREAMILQTAQTDGKDVRIALEVEGGSGGKESGENTVRMLAGYVVFAYHPTGDKISRAYPFASQVGAGNVKCLNREWTKEYLDELRFFPHSRYTDQVDASGGAFNRLARKKVRVGGV
jgi:predicted phage terminase large subunit-like protein